MNRRNAILGGGLLVSGCFQKAPPVVVKETKKCPCVDPDDHPQNPLQRSHVQICAFHITKQLVIQPNVVQDRQLEVWHYCTPVSEGVFQCQLYDSEDANAKLIGVEYVVSKEIYESLPVEEQKLWHPHFYEIMNGLLTIHGVTDQCEEKLVKALLQTYGKSWHTWPDPKTKVPTGYPYLMWSATESNPVNQELITAKEKKLGFKTEDIKEFRHKKLLIKP